uniref:Uncharacterized protein n=1 Tax=Knipowitschia caucasica TaxID=637954 RepID=A0AAV2IYL8_KNICA
MEPFLSTGEEIIRRRVLAETSTADRGRAEDTPGDRAPSSRSSLHHAPVISGEGWAGWTPCLQSVSWWPP